MRTRSSRRQTAVQFSHPSPAPLALAQDSTLGGDGPDSQLMKSSPGICFKGAVLAELRGLLLSTGRERSKEPMDWLKSPCPWSEPVQRRSYD